MMKSKIGKGLVSLLTIIILLVSVLASTVYYDNQITANAIKEYSFDSAQNELQITEANDIYELSQLNEGWYSLRSGYVFYLEHFDSYIPLYIRVNNPLQKNEIFVVDEEGNVEVKKFDDENIKFFSDNENDNNLITGEVTGMEGVTGRQTAVPNCVSTINTIGSTVWKNTRYIQNLGCEYLYEDSRSEKIWTYKKPDEPTRLYWNQNTDGFKDRKWSRGIYFSITNTYDSRTGKITFYSGEKTLQAIGGLPDKGYVQDTGDNFYPVVKKDGKYFRLLSNGEPSDKEYDFNDVKNFLTKEQLPPSRTIIRYSDAGIATDLTTQQINDAKKFNQDSKNQAYVEQFKQYLMLVEGKTEAEANEIISNPKYVSDYQYDSKNLDFALDNSNGKIGQKTAEAATQKIRGEILDGTIKLKTPDNKEFNLKNDLIKGNSGQDPETIEPGKIVQIGDKLYYKSKQGEHAKEFQYGWNLAETEQKKEYQPDWKYLKHSFTIKATDSDKVSSSFKFDGTYEELEAHKKLMAGQGFTDIEDKRATTEEATQEKVKEIEGEWVPSDKGNYITNTATKKSKFAQGISKEVLANQENNKIKIEKAYNDWLKTLSSEHQKLDAKVLQEIFVKTSGLDLQDSNKRQINPEALQKLIRANFGLPEPEEGAETEKPTTTEEKKPYSTMTGNDGTILYIKDRKVISQGTAKRLEDEQQFEGKLKEYTSLNAVDENGNSLYKSKDGKVYSVNTKESTINEIKGTSYTTMEKLTSNSDISILKTKNIEDGQITAIRLKTGAGEMTVDGSTALRIEQADRNKQKINLYFGEKAKAVVSEFPAEKEIKADTKIYSPANPTHYWKKCDDGSGSYCWFDENDKQVYSEALNNLDYKNLNRIYASQKELMERISGPSPASNTIEITNPATGNLLEKRELKKAGNEVVLGYIATYSEIYIDKQGNRLSQKEAEELNKKKPDSARLVSQASQERIRQEDGSYSSTTYRYRAESYTDKDGKKQYIRVGEGETRNEKTGKSVGFTYIEADPDEPSSYRRVIFNEKGDFVKAVDINGEEIQNSQDKDKLKNRATSSKNQHKSRQFFSNVERVFTEFRGLGFYATLFIDEDKLLEWREAVDKYFVLNYLSSQYYSSKICSSWLDGTQEGIAYAETPQGLAQIGAHVEATRTKPITADGATEFLYKITFNVKNGDYEKDVRAPEEMRINVMLIGERSIDVFKQDQAVKRGTSFGKSGKNAIVKYSGTFYSQVCIRFDKVPEKWKIKDKLLCNVIQESSEEPTTIKVPAAPGSGSSPATEINDF